MAKKPEEKPPVEVAPKDDFKEESKEILEKIKKPVVNDVSAFDDLLSGPGFRQAEDPYEGKSMAEMLRMKREQIEKDLQKNSKPDE